MQNHIKTNYQIICDQILQEISAQNHKPSLLLHTCCGPCSSYVLEYLSQYFRITVLYYNPNIDTVEEHALRTREQADLLKKMGLDICFVPTEYDPQTYYEAVKGHEQDREGGPRCSLCYRLRLEEAASYAKAQGFDFFTTSLSISPMKNAAKLNQIGLELEKEYGVRYLISDFKKKGGYLRSIALSKQFGMYRQEYCGCVFSKIEREKFLLEKQEKIKENLS